MNNRLYAGFKRISFVALLALSIFVLTTGVQAKTKTVYVISHITKGEDKTKVSYTKSNLVKTIKSSSDTIKYSYNKKNQISKIVKISGKLKTTCKPEWDAKGILAKYTSTTEQGKKITTFKIDKQGRIASGKMVSGKTDGVEDIANIKFKYDKKGMLTKKSSDKSSLIHYAMKYDNNNNIKSRNIYVPTATVYEEWSNKYKNSRLTTTVISTNTVFGDYQLTVKYSYKKVTVDEKLAKVIEEQQWWLRNFYELYALYLNS